MKDKIKRLLHENLDTAYHSEITDLLILEIMNNKSEKVYDILFANLSTFSIMHLKYNTKVISEIFDIVKYELKN